MVAQLSILLQRMPQADGGLIAMAPRVADDRGGDPLQVIEGARSFLTDATSLIQQVELMLRAAHNALSQLATPGGPDEEPKRAVYTVAI